MMILTCVLYASRQNDIDLMFYNLRQNDINTRQDAINPWPPVARGSPSVSYRQRREEEEPQTQLLRQKPAQGSPPQERLGEPLPAALHPVLHHTIPASLYNGCGFTPDAHHNRIINNGCVLHRTNHHSTTTPHSTRHQNGYGEDDLSGVTPRPLLHRYVYHLPSPTFKC